jgi:hypothetical protein
MFGRATLKQALAVSPLAVQQVSLVVLEEVEVPAQRWLRASAMVDQPRQRRQRSGCGPWPWGVAAAQLTAW